MTPSQHHHNHPQSSPHCRTSHMGMPHNGQQDQPYPDQQNQNYNYETGVPHQHQHHPMSNQQGYHGNHYYHGTTSSQSSTLPPNQHHSHTSGGYYKNASPGYAGPQHSQSAMSGHVDHGPGHPICEGGMASSYANGYPPTHRHMNPTGSTPIVPRPPATQMPTNHSSRVHLSRLRHGGSPALMSPTMNSSKMRGGNASEAQVS